MTAYTVWLNTSAGRERQALTVHGSTMRAAACMAAYICDVPEDLVQLEVQR